MIPFSAKKAGRPLLSSRFDTCLVTRQCALHKAARNRNPRDRERHHALQLVDGTATRTYSGATCGDRGVRIDLKTTVTQGLEDFGSWPALTLHTLQDESGL